MRTSNMVCGVLLSGLPMWACSTGATTEFVDPAITPLAPGLAHVTTGFRTVLRSPEAPAFTFGGAMTMTVVHRDGGWRILQGHTSSARGRTGEGGA